MKKIYIIILLLLIMLKSSSAQTINLSELSLDEKIAQMIIIRGDIYDERFTELGIGGVFLDKQKTEEEYKALVNQYQNNSKIKLFVSTDLEGYWNPFPFFQSKNFGEIKTEEEAYNLGISHGKILGELGFNINFAPIAESKNTVWPGRSFTGTNEETKEKISAYIKGLRSQKILATAKHYPGGNMLKDPHWRKVSSEITESDLFLFKQAISSNVSAIMIGHAIVSGALDSKGKQSTVSPEVIFNLRSDFHGLIITDAVQMLGLRLSYLFRPSRLYPDLIKAGNDIILDTSKTNQIKIKNNIKRIKKEIEKGEIEERQIDSSVKRILKAKGYSVAY